MRLRRARDEGRLEYEAVLMGCIGLLVVDELVFPPPGADAPGTSFSCLLMPARVSRS